MPLFILIILALCSCHSKEFTNIISQLNNEIVITELPLDSSSGLEYPARPNELLGMRSYFYTIEDINSNKKITCLRSYKNRYYAVYHIKNDNSRNLFYFILFDAKCQVVDTMAVSKLPDKQTFLETVRKNASWKDVKKCDPDAELLPDNYQVSFHRFEDGTMASVYYQDTVDSADGKIVEDVIVYEDPMHFLDYLLPKDLAVITE